MIILHVLLQVAFVWLPGVTALHFSMLGVFSGHSVVWPLGLFSEVLIGLLCEYVWETFCKTVVLLNMCVRDNEKVWLQVSLLQGAHMENAQSPSESLTSSETADLTLQPYSPEETTHRLTNYQLL